MKNFTKQNFKTNPLWVRLLIMVFMLIGANTAWSAYYAVGPAVGGWGTWVELKTTDNNKYTCVASPGEFKITNENGGWGLDKNWDNVVGGTGVTKSNNNGNNASLQSGYNQICFYPSGNNNNGWLEGEKVSITATAYVVGGYYGGNDVNYNSGKKLTKQSDGTYSGTFNNFSGDCYFQVFDDVSRVWGCDYTEKNVGESVTLSTSKADKVRYSLVNGTSYVFTFNPSDGSFSVRLACVDVKAPIVTADPICSGTAATLKLTNRQTGVAYKLNSTSGITIFSSGDTYTTSALDANTTYKIYASHTNACTNNVKGDVTVTVASAPTTPTLNTTDEFLSIGESATLTIGNKESGVTYTLYKDGVSTSKVTNGTQFTNITDAGVYTVKGSKSANPSGCKETGFSNEVTIRTCTSATYSIAFTNDVTSINKEATILASVTPSGTGYGTVTWKSGTPSVATINASGVITGVKFGTSTITATVADGDTYCGGTATETITVKETPTISISGETTFCGTSTTLTANIGGLTDGNTAGKTITWYKDGGASSVGTGATYNATATGIYTAKITGTYIKETTSDGFSVTKKATPTASNFTYEAPSNLTYSNSTKSAIVGWNGTQGGAITVKYSSTSNSYTAATPEDAGTYYVFVSTEANENYCAVTDLYINTFKIAPAEQTDFSVTNDDYSICGKSVTVTAAGGQSDGAITYSITTDNTSTKDASIDPNTGVLTVKSAGEVSVKAQRAGTTNYQPITDNVTFTFTMPIENVKLAVKNTSVKASYCKDEEITLVLTYDGPTPDFNNNEFEWVLSGIQTGTKFIGFGTNGINSGSEFTLQLGGVGVNKVGVNLKGCNGWVTSTDENSVNVTVNAIPDAPFEGVAQSTTICDGATFIYDVAYIWYTSADGQEKVSGSANLSETTTYYISKKVYNCESARTAYTVNVDQPLVAPTLTTTNPTTCNDNPTAGSIVIENNANYSNEISFALYKDENPTSITYNNGFAISGGGDYKVVMTTSASNVCGQSVETEPIKVTVQDNTPTITNAAITAGEDAVCVNTGTTLTASATTDKGTLSYLWNTDATTENIETGNLTENTTYTVTITATNEDCPSTSEVFKTITVNPVSEAAVELNSITYDRASKKFSFSATLTNAGCSQDVYVGYQYKLANSDTWNNALVRTHRLTGENAVDGKTFSKSDFTIDDVISGQTYTFRAYAINGYQNYNESSAVYSNTKDVLVQEGYTVYVRRPKSEDGTNVYANFYAYSSVKGSTMYVKSGSISGQAETNNTGGTIMTEAFTDCEGYVWDSFVAESGQTQFYVRALNDGDTKGWATFSQTATINADEDNYFYLSSWADGQYGVTITNTTKPALDVRIAALGSTDVKSNNMASFAALYLSGNCSGKEIKEYQWMYSNNNGTSWSNYTGVGSAWNNIRPTAAGKYKLVCTFMDDSTMDSNILPITNSTGSYTAGDLIDIKSSLPIIMVNTGENYGFPDCVNNSDYPSKHAGELKEKLSVDVKIKVGDEIVYDKKARMNYRGSSSLNFKKKSYAFCPGADNCGTDKDKSADFVETTKIDMLSLITKGVKTSVADKDWVLYAANPDPSMMRNILAMEAFADMTGKWGVKNQYVELYVDGKYEGVYVFMDKVTQNDNGRVQITWDVKDPTKRGFILKFDKTDVEDRYEGNGDKKTFESKLGTGNTGVISYGTEIDQRFEIEYPEKKKIEKAGGSWDDVYGFVKGKVDAFEEALSKGDFATVRTIIDYESWADFFLINEFSKNADGFRASCIFVYENNLLKAYPLWDYELSFDNKVRQEHNVDKEEGLLVKSTTYSKVTGNDGTFPCPFWWTGNYYNSKTYKGLLDDPCFVSMIKTRWDQHKVGALSASSLQTLVSGYNTALTKTDNTTTYNTPKAREEKRWPYNGDARGKSDCNEGGTGYYGINEGTVQNFSQSKTTLDNWIKDTGRRYGDNGSTGGLEGEITKLSSEIDFVISAVADKTTTSPWRPVSVTVSSNSSYTYAITPEPAQVKVNGNVYTIYMARPDGTEGENFSSITNAYTFIATSGTQDECGSSTGEPAKATVNITLEDVVENCDK